MIYFSFDYCLDSSSSAGPSQSGKRSKRKLNTTPLAALSDSEENPPIESYNGVLKQPQPKFKNDRRGPQRPENPKKRRLSGSFDISSSKPSNS